MSKEPTDGENDMIAELLSKLVLEIKPYLQGEFLDAFVVDFELELRTYKLSLVKLTDPFLPERCQSKEDGVCNLRSGSCQQCLPRKV